MVKNKEYNSSKLFVNRELSWLEFNNRVLEEGLDESLPLLERLKFLSIVSSNLDEFFMVRVAGLIQQRDAGIRRKDKSGLTPSQQLKIICQRVHKIMDTHTSAVKDIIEKLKMHGLFIIQRKEWTIEQRKFIENYFINEILPVLTPLAMQELQPSPLLHGRRLTVAVLVQSNKDEKNDGRIILIPVPAILNRFVQIPSEQFQSYVLIEDVIADNAGLLFNQEKILSTAYFRIIRDADVTVQEDEASDLLSMIEQAVLERKRRSGSPGYIC